MTDRDDVLRTAAMTHYQQLRQRHAALLQEANTIAQEMAQLEAALQPKQQEEESSQTP